MTRGQTNKRKSTKKNNPREANVQQQHDVNNTQKIIICGVCGKGDGKYKCPQCRTPFCCVQCSKDHKATACPAAAAAIGHQPTIIVNGNNGSNNSRNPSSNTPTVTSFVEASKYLAVDSKSCIQYYSNNHLRKTKRPQRTRRHDDDGCEEDDDSHNDEPGWNITDEMKNRIQQSMWLRKELQDGGLRQLIETIDRASDTEEEEEEGEEEGEGKVAKERGNTTSTARGKNDWKHKHKTANSSRIISARELALARTKYSHSKFATFTDQLLLMVGVLQPANNTENINYLLSSDEDGFRSTQHHDHLILAPIPRLNTTNNNNDNDNDDISHYSSSDESGSKSEIDETTTSSSASSSSVEDDSAMSSSSSTDEEDNQP